MQATIDCGDPLGRLERPTHDAEVLLEACLAIGPAVQIHHDHAIEEGRQIHGPPRGRERARLGRYLVGALGLGDRFVVRG
jgi:hypothetical protein